MDWQLIERQETERRNKYAILSLQDIQSEISQGLELEMTLF